MALYLGLDSSTQSLTAVAIDIDGDRRQVVLVRSLSFDRELPAYGTRHGVLPAADPLVAEAPPSMWAEALERMLADLAASGIDASRVKAVAGSAQQHGSVCLAHGAGERLANLSPDQPLIDQLRGTGGAAGSIFSRDRSPIWMDASTSEDCDAITRAVGGAHALAELTGSRAFERFTGPQIRKFARLDPDGYARTERIHLVSSFLASLLAGRHAPIDPGDGSGMNLMDLRRRTWSPLALDATAPGLAAKLPPIEASWQDIGPLAPYWQRRHGLPPARVIAWSGDNPCSLVGTGLVREGLVAVSLGTSDTVFGLMREPRVDATGTGHVFGAPTGDYMGLTCFANGSLARERVREAVGGGWTEFSGALRATPPGNGGTILLPWFVPEITPHVAAPGARWYGRPVASPAEEARAVVEGQALAMAAHARWMGVTITTIHATGGASANPDILQVLADVFDADVLRFEAGHSAALGAALRAWHADERASGRERAWEDIVSGLADPVTASRVSPRPAFRALYDDMLEVRGACEAHALGRGPDPAPVLARFSRRHGGLR
ncbi:MAG: FGGY-family carbohydrate kinase [Vicinamibacterales bacterium]|nr:FGGY-family carbohydrate kinase [Vicinamibacterales bacterium]